MLHFRKLPALHVSEGQHRYHIFTGTLKLLLVKSTSAAAATATGFVEDRVPAIAGLLDQVVIEVAHLKDGLVPHLGGLAGLWLEIASEESLDWAELLMGLH